MDEIIQQRVPGGSLTSEEQVDLALEVVRKAAQLLEFSALDEIEDALDTIGNPLVVLASAGVLSAITFSLQDLQGVCGATVILDPYSIEDYEEMDLSPLRLLANPEACGSIEIACVDMEIAQSILGEEEWLPLPSPSLEFSQVPATVSNNADETYEEESDEYNDDQA